MFVMCNPGRKVRISPAKVPTPTSPPTMPSMFGNVVIHFVNVTSKLWPRSPPLSASATCVLRVEGRMVNPASSTRTRSFAIRLVKIFFPYCAHQVARYLRTYTKYGLLTSHLNTIPVDRSACHWGANQAGTTTVNNLH